MRNMRWLRFGLASLVVASAGAAALLACSDDAATPASPKTDGGAGPGANDSGDPVTDGGTDAKPDSEVPPQFAKLTVVNAVADLGPAGSLGAYSGVRVCFRIGQTVDKLTFSPYPPVPREAPSAGLPPGIPVGTGGAFPNFGTNLEPLILEPIIINAVTLAQKGFVKPADGGTESVCDEIVPTLTADVDYWTLPPIPAGTFKSGKSFLLALTGCPQNSDPSIGERCGLTGPTAPGKGSLALTIAELERAPVGPTDLGVQFAHFSKPFEVAFAVAPGTMQPGFITDADGGFAPVTTGPATLGTVTAPVGVKNIVDEMAFAANKTIPGGNGPLAPYPLTAIQKLSFGSAAAPPTPYKAGANFVFVAVGDVTLPKLVWADGTAADGGAGSVFNTRFFHFLAFPTDPEIKAYKP